MNARGEEAATGHPDSGLAMVASRHLAVGLEVGVVRDGRLDLFHGHGLADIASCTPVTENTVFRIGSITKTFTAVVLPAGDADGLPRSVQMIGPRYREDPCLDAAAAIEDRLGALTPIDPR